MEAGDNWMDQRRQDQLSSLFWLGLAVIFCIASIRLSVGTLQQPGSGFFPFLGGSILGLLSLVNFLKSLKGVPSKAESSGSPVKWKNIIVSLAILFAFPSLLDLMGFAPATFLFFAFLLRLIEPQRWAVVFGGSASATIVLYFIFQFWLKIQFPIGFFGI
jgi:putative tricarboxylic transport membrane protein